ncbi:hypothetical protein [Tamaricihabitans halophyticus]|uniref:hypothetical protein n=1 Tax=Tamaricihabitans halophyticus TaxID=1262583 RepID=UPI001050B26B|nr:hypothetical protein [Tamaricihabitans halophyticus]
MTWQEELRKLDEELAAGRIAADDYRVRRDQVLSSAVAPGEQGQQPAEPGGQPHPNQPPQGQPPQGQPPQGQPPQGQPPQGQPPHGGQPPFGQQGQPAPGQPAAQPPQAGQAPQGGAAPDSTQIISAIPAAETSGQQPPGQQPPAGPPQQGNDAAERTQAVPPGWQRGGAEPERTQAVQPGQQPLPPYGQQPGSPPAGFPAPGAPSGGFPAQQGHPGPGSPPSGFPTQGQQGYGGPQGYPGQGYSQPEHQAPWHTEDDDSPPWGGDIPLMSPGSTSDWVKQGPEVFDEDSRPKKGKTIFAISGAVVLLAVAGLAVWFFVLQGDGGEGGGGGGGGQASPSQSQEQPVPLNEVLPDPPGQADSDNGTLKPQDARQSGRINQEEVAALEEAGVKEIQFKGSTDGDFTYQAMAFETADKQAADKLAQSLYETAKKSGMVDGSKGERLPQEVEVTQQSQFPKSGAYQLVYAADDRVIRVLVEQEPIGDDDKELIGKFQTYTISAAENVAK